MPIRHVFQFLAAIAMMATLLPASQVLPGVDVPAASAQEILDDELVVLESNGSIVVKDPYVPPGGTRVVWQSPDSGWQNVATGDLNGDGDDEIIALRGGETRAFDPVVVGTPVSFSVLVSGQQWERVVTGDIDRDDRDEIILTRTASEGGISERLQAYDGNATGTSWTLIYNQGYGAPWRHLATGDVDADGRDELAAIRDVDQRITIWDPAENWRLLHDESYDFQWLSIEIGNTHADSSGKDELVLTRSGVKGDLNSYLIFRCCSGENLIDVTGAKHFPYFSAIALGDINNSGGDDEVFLLRDPEGSGVALIGYNYGTDSAISFETLAGQRQWKQIHTGDFDADGRAELAVMSAGEYRIYTQPHANLNFDSYAGSFISSGYFAVGDLDGARQQPGPRLTLTPDSWDIPLTAGQTATRDISVTNSGDGSVISWTASVTSGQSWLSVLTPSGTTPGTLRIRVVANPPPQTYQGVVRVAAVGNVANSPQDFVVNLTVLAAQFNATPKQLSWTIPIGGSASSQEVLVTGDNIAWSAVMTTLEEGAALQEALAKPDTTVQALADRLVVTGAEGTTEVSIVDWFTVVPASGVATPSGQAVQVTPIVSKLPLGYSQVALVFVGDENASPRSIVVDLFTRLYDPASLRFNYLPVIQR